MSWEYDNTLLLIQPKIVFVCFALLAHTQFTINSLLQNLCHKNSIQVFCTCFVFPK